MRALLAMLILAGTPDAGTSRVVLPIPTKLAIVRTATTLSIAVAERDRKPLTVEATPGLTLGVEHQLIVTAQGKRTTSEGLSSGTDFNLGTRILNRATDGIPVPGTRYRVELKLTVFETDRAPEHLWSPQGPKYRVLWTGHLEQQAE